MNHSRREFGLLFAAAAAGKAIAADPTLSSKIYAYSDLAVRARGLNNVRPIFNGELHNGFAIEMHESELAAGQAPHPPHHHVHEEIFIVREGTLEVLLGEKKTVVHPGDVVFIASGLEHGWRNVGQTNARYYLFALGPNWDYRERVAQ
jgi:quercetin dioxygenase-like cupin family protein